jgi:polyene macrolide polyketide synthase
MSVALPSAAVESRLGTGLSIAAVNGPRSVVVSGDPGAVQRLRQELEGDGVRVRVIPVDYASHSEQVQLLRAELLDVLAGIEPKPVQVPFYSTVDAGWLDGPECDAQYWFRNLRQTVRFAPAVQALLDEQYRVFVEVSAHPVVTTAVQEAIDDAGVAAVATGTLRRDQDGLVRVLASAAELFTRGVAVDWPVDGGRQIPLPTYAFQGQRYWDSGVPVAFGDPTALGLGAAGHPLLGAAVELAESGGVLFTARLAVTDVRPVPLPRNRPARTGGPRRRRGRLRARRGADLRRTADPAPAGLRRHPGVGGRTRRRGPP